MIFLPLAGLLVALVVAVARRASNGSVTTAGVALAWTPTAVVRTPAAWPRVNVLARAEARRLATHPLLVAGAVLAVLAVGVGTPDATQLYFELTGAGATGLYLPPLVLLAAHLNVTRARRAGAEDLLRTTPMPAADRTLAACLAGLLVAGGVLVWVLAAAAYHLVVGGEPVRWPGPFELALLPLSVLGAATLGTMAGRWLPWRGAGAPVLILMVAITGMLAGDLGGRAGLFGPYAELVHWEATTAGPAVPHVVAAHALYILGLDAMAVVGAVLRHRRTPLWWGLGAAAVLWTAAMGLWQIS